MKATIKFKGLINVSGFHVDPGFKGHLIYSVYNAGPSAIHLERGMDMFLIWYADLDNASNNYVRTKEGHKTISPTLINNISGEILSLHDLSNEIKGLKDKVFRFLLIGGVLLSLFGLLMAPILKDRIVELLEGEWFVNSQETEINKSATSKVESAKQQSKDENSGPTNPPDETQNGAKK